MLYNNVLEALGHTPLIRLSRMSEPDAAEILVKYEGVNIGGSAKTRTAAKMIEEAEKRGEIGPGSIIVEPTSGNQGIGLALVCAVKGYEARIIMPDSVSEERRKLVRHYGANVIVVHDEGDIGKAIDECIQIANRMAAESRLPTAWRPKIRTCMFPNSSRTWTTCARTVIIRRSRLPKTPVATFMVSARALAPVAPSPVWARR